MEREMQAKLELAKHLKRTVTCNMLINQFEKLFVHGLILFF